MALKDPNKSSIRGSTRVLQGFYKDSIGVLKGYYKGSIEML